MHHTHQLIDVALRLLPCTGIYACLFLHPLSVCDVSSHGILHSAWNPQGTGGLGNSKTWPRTPMTFRLLALEVILKMAQLPGMRAGSELMLCLAHINAKMTAVEANLSRIEARMKMLNTPH